jgi:hypothetical protein
VASLVLSECMFLSAALTLNKQHNHLMRNVIKALEFLLECMYHNNLILHKVAMAIKEEEELKDMNLSI